MPKRIDLSGHRYGRLLVLGRAEDYVSPTGHRKTQWHCLCDCGIKRVVQGNSMRSGATTSCGCWHKEATSQAVTTHGHGGTPEYRAWVALIQRCTNPAVASWSQYGGRGITVCDRWLTSLEAFLNDMGPRPAGHSIDRIDNEQGYFPENCRWADPKAQARNRRNTRFAMFRGERKMLCEIAEELGVSLPLLHHRIRLGWPETRWGAPPNQKASA